MSLYLIVLMSTYFVDWKVQSRGQSLLYG